MKLDPAGLPWSDDGRDLPARVSGLMLWLAVASVLSGIFDVKYYLHLQVCPACLVRRPFETFPFCTACTTHLNSSPSTSVHQATKELTPTAVWVLLTHLTVLEALNPPPRLSIIQPPFRHRALDLQRGSSD